MSIFSLSFLSIRSPSLSSFRSRHFSLPIFLLVLSSFLNNYLYLPLSFSSISPCPSSSFFHSWQFFSSSTLVFFLSFSLYLSTIISTSHSVSILLLLLFFNDSSFFLSFYHALPLSFFLLLFLSIILFIFPLSSLSITSFLILSTTLFFTLMLLELYSTSGTGCAHAMHMRQYMEQSVPKVRPLFHHTLPKHLTHYTIQYLG